MTALQQPHTAPATSGSSASILRAVLDTDPDLARRYAKLRNHASHVSMSMYEVTDRCNLRCEGCLYFEGQLADRAKPTPPTSPDAFAALFAAEVARGINYPQFGGAEPALHMEVLERATRYWQRGVVHTNGTVFIPAHIPYMLHISTWGLDSYDARMRGTSAFATALKLYKGDSRVVVVCTINRDNIGQIEGVVRLCREHGLPVTFNLFTPSRDYLHKLETQAPHDPKSTFRLGTQEDNPTLDEQTRRDSHAMVQSMMDRYPETVLMAPLFNDTVHSSGSLYDLDPATGRARDCRVFNDKRSRSHYIDLSVYPPELCCFPNFDCATCRIYPALYTKLIFERSTYFRSAEGIRRWIEVYETWCRLYLPHWEQLG